MDFLERKYDEEFLYRMRDEVLLKVEKNEEFQKLSREAEKLSSEFPIILDLFEGIRMDDVHKLTKEERQAIRKYVELYSKMGAMHEFAHYYRGHGDCILHLSCCGFFEGREEKRLSISDMTELIRIHDAYKALNRALFGGELSLGFDSGYIGALGRIYKVIDDNIPRSMKAVSIEILGDTSVEPEQRAKMLLQGKDR